MPKMSVEERIAKKEGKKRESQGHLEQNETAEEEAMPNKKQKRERGERGGARNKKAVSRAEEETQGGSAVPEDGLDDAPVERQKRQRGERGGARAKKTVPAEGEEEDGKGAESVDKTSSRGVKRGTEAGRLDEELLPYVKEVTVLARANEFEADEDRELFVDNVWRELKMRKSEQLVRLITHKEGSAAVESLLPLSSPKQLYRVIRGFKGTMARVIFNPYGSHVLEALFGFVPALVNASMDELTKKDDDNEEEEEGNEEEEDKGALEPLEKMFQATCDELAGGWMEIMMDARGSHVLRAILRALAGLEPKGKAPPSATPLAPPAATGAPASAKFGKGPQKQTHGTFRPAEWTRHAVPASFVHRLSSIVTELAAEESAQELSEMALNSAAAPVLQMLLLAVRTRPELVEGIARALLRWDSASSMPDKEWVRKMAEDECGSHMLEALIQVLPADGTLDVHTLVDAMRGSFVQLSRQRTANHVVQRLIERTEALPHVKLMLHELAAHVAELLQWNRPGVVRALADMCARSGESQGQMVMALAKALGLAAPQDHARLVPALLLLEQVAEDYAGVPGSVSVLQGSLILQTLVLYAEAALAPVLKSFAALSPDYLARIACDNSGSRALEAFFGSKTVPLKAKNKVTQRLIEMIVKVAGDRCGSHVIEEAYRAANVESKKSLVEALAKEFKTLAKSHFGAMVCKRCRVEQFVSAAADWEATEERAVKKRDLFADIVGDAANGGGGGGKSAGGGVKKGWDDKAKGREEVKDKGKSKGVGGGFTLWGGEKRVGQEGKEEDETAEGKERKEKQAAERRAKDVGGSKYDDTMKALSGDAREGKEKKHRKDANELSADSKIDELFASAGNKRKARGSRA